MKVNDSSIQPLITAVAACAVGAFAGHLWWTKEVEVRVSSSAFSRACETADRPYVQDKGSVPDSGALRDVPDMPIQFFAPSGYDASTMSGYSPTEVMVYSEQRTPFLRAEEQRVGVVDIAPVGNVLYSMASLPPAASNMAVAEALAAQFINAQDATQAKCSREYWNGPNLPGELEALEITRADGRAVTATIAVVGDPAARVVLFTNGDQANSIDSSVILDIGRTMRRVNR